MQDVLEPRCAEMIIVDVLPGYRNLSERERPQNVARVAFWLSLQLNSTGKARKRPCCSFGTPLGFLLTAPKKKRTTNHKCVAAQRRCWARDVLLPLLAIGNANLRMSFLGG